MINGNRVLAIVPARSGSKGLIHKNIRPLLGRPLLAWPIVAARSSRYVDRVVLSTDSLEYADVGIKSGADVPFIRPAELASDTALSVDLVIQALDSLEIDGDFYDIIVLLEPTSPMTENYDIDLALEKLVANPKSKSVVGVSALGTQHPAYSLRLDSSTGLIKPAIGKCFGALPRRQELEPLFVLDGSFYVSTVPAIRERRTFCHDATLGIPMDRHKAMEVDDMIDFVCIEAIMKFRVAENEYDGEGQ